MTEAKAIKKITEDFEGAKKYWETHFIKWTFVHNADDGLPSHVHKVLLDFQQANQDMSIETWGLEELRTVFRQISLEDKQIWLGLVPTDKTKIKLGFDDLKPILESLATRTVSVNLQIKDVPQGKIEANALSESAATLIKQGMSKADLVRQFFDKWHDLNWVKKSPTHFESSTNY